MSKYTFEDIVDKKSFESGVKSLQDAFSKLDKSMKGAGIKDMIALQKEMVKSEKDLAQASLLRIKTEKELLNVANLKIKNEQMISDAITKDIKLENEAIKTKQLNAKEASRIEKEKTAIIEKETAKREKIQADSAKELIRLEKEKGIAIQKEAAKREKIKTDQAKMDAEYDKAYYAASKRNKEITDKRIADEKKKADAIAKGTKEEQKAAKVEADYMKAMSMTVKTEQDLIFQTNALVAKRKTLDTTTKEGNALNKQLTQQIAKNTAELKINDAAIGRHQREVGNYQNALKGLGGAFQNLLGAFGLAGGLMMFASLMKNAFSEMMKFSKAVSNLSAITGIAGTQLASLKSKAIEMGAGVEGGASAVIESYKLIASANSDLAGNADALAEISKQAIILSQASGATLQDSTQQLMQILNKMGVEASGAGKSLDILAASAKWGTAEIPQVTESLLAMGGTMKLVAKDTNSANDNVREANSLIQVLAKNGKIGAEAGTGLRNVLLKLAAVDVLPKAAVKQLKDAGVNMAMLKDTTIPLTDRLKELSKISGNAAALTKVFGVENIEVGKIILDNTKLFDDYNIKLDENGVAIEQANVNMNNLSGDLVKAGESWKSLLLSMETGSGTTGKFLRSIVQQFTTLMGMFSRSESGMFKGLENIAVTGNLDEIQKKNEAILQEINYIATTEQTLSGRRKASTKSEIEQQTEKLNLIEKQLSADKITLIFDRREAAISSEKTRLMAYQNGVLALRIKYLKDQSALVRMNIDGLSKDVKITDEKINTDEKGNKISKESNDLLEKTNWQSAIQLKQQKEYLQNINKIQNKKIDENKMIYDLQRMAKNPKKGQFNLDTWIMEQLGMSKDSDSYFRIKELTKTFVETAYNAAQESMSQSKAEADSRVEDSKRIQEEKKTELKKELENIETRKRAGLAYDLTEKQRLENQIKEEAKRQKKAEAESKRLSIIMKNMAMAQAAGNTALAITEALKIAGPYKWVEVGLIAATGLVQLNTISKQKYAKGGSFVLSGLSHEQGGINLGGGREAEGGEAVSIFSKNVTAKNYTNIRKITDEINKGEYNWNKKNDINVIVSNNKEVAYLAEIAKNTELQVTHNLKGHRIEKKGNITIIYN